MSRVLPFLLALAGTCVLVAAESTATTPDGATPADETVCDSLTGSEYGLCVAYCEAMDCDSDAPQASATACERVLDQFARASGGDAPPCADPCPGEGFWGEELAHLGDACDDFACGGAASACAGEAPDGTPYGYCCTGDACSAPATLGGFCSIR